MRALALLMIAGCIDQPNPPLIPTSCSSINYYESNFNNQLDMLFVIDDSQAMTPYQAALEANAPVFINILHSLPLAPSLHLAAARASDGSLVDPVPCGASPGATFLIASNAWTVQNFTGDLAQVFTCMTRVGTTGGHQQVMASGLTALANNPGFLRTGSFLGLVIIAASDDGSPDEPASYISQFQQLEAVPNHIYAAAVAHQPSARLQSFIDAFGSLGTIVSIDQQSWADAFAVFARNIGAFIGPQCIDGVLIQPANCSFTIVQNIGTAQQRELLALPTCNPNGQSGACGALLPDTVYCQSSGTRYLVCWNGFDPLAARPCPDGSNVPPDNATAVVECAVQCR